MCDIVYADLNQEGWIRAIPLVMECEWGEEGDVWDDFQKLLIIRAGIRVMIFAANSRDEVLRLVSKFCEWIENFRLSQGGDRYLSASYVHAESPPFSVEEYVYSLEQ